MARTRYEYQSAQSSVLRPHYRRLVWEPALAIVPETVAPNTLTVLSTAACALSFALAATLAESPAAMVAAALAVFVYVSLDNMDGAQARRAGRSSRLGEFLDHWLDTLNNGFVTLGACLAAGLPPRTALAVLALTTLAFFAVQLELRHTGVFRMGRVADVEGNTAVVLLYLAIAAGGPGLFAVEPVAGLPPLAVWLAVGVGAQAAWTLLSAAKRLPAGRGDLVPIALAHALLLLWAAWVGRVGAAHLAIAFLANPVFTSRPVLARLVSRSTAPLDWTAVGALAFAALASVFGLVPPDGGLLAWAVAGLFAVIALRHATSTIAAVRGEAPVAIAVADEDGARELG